MRITEDQKLAFIESILEVCEDGFQLYLFGSRTQNSSRGGDIDLLIVTSDSESLRLKSKKPLLLAKMKMKTTDEKIDITIISLDEMKSSPFVKTIDKILLYKNV